MLLKHKFNTRLWFLRVLFAKKQNTAAAKNPTPLLLKAQKHRRYSPQSGQGMTEYLIIVALIALAAVGVYRYLGSVISNKTAAIAQSIAGNDSTDANTEASAAANNAAQEAKKKNAPPNTNQANTTPTN